MFRRDRVVLRIFFIRAQIIRNVAVKKFARETRDCRHCRATANNCLFREPRVLQKFRSSNVIERHRRSIGILRFFSLLIGTKTRRQTFNLRTSVGNTAARSTLSTVRAH